MYNVKIGAEFVKKNYFLWIRFIWKERKKINWTIGNV